MRICRHVSVILVIVISTISYADEKEHKEGLQEILPQFTSAWNKAQVSDFMALFHPDSRLKKSYDTDQRMRRYIDMSFAQMFFVFGEVTNSQIRQYIERKRRFVVQVTYKNKGIIPGTFAVKKYNDKWLIDDFNPDGQLEPELNE